MIAILGKGFISCLISSNNRNLQLLSFQKIDTLLGVYETCDREAATMRVCHLGYADTLIHLSQQYTYLHKIYVLFICRHSYQRTLELPGNFCRVM